MRIRRIAWPAVWGLAPLLIGAAMQAVPAKAAEEPGDPIPGLTRAEEETHVRGRRLFRWELWRPDRNAPGFNETECSKCHLEPMFGGSNTDPKTFVAFVPDEKSPSGWKSFHRLHRDENRRFVAPEKPANADMRRAPSLYGLGLLEAIPDATIQSWADPGDKNGDGISGRYLTIDGKIGRFGWKGDVKSIEAFTINAFKNEMGIGVEAYDRADFEGLSMIQIRAVAYYIRTLSPPATTKVSGDVKVGKAVFDRIKCGSCHIPSATTDASNVGALSRKTIAAYTDLLLHDVGDSAKLQVSEGPVAKDEYRTPALWGIGSFVGPYWHDGSARTIEDAIFKHGGEALDSRTAFEKLGQPERESLMRFLKSL